MATCYYCHIEVASCRALGPREQFMTDQGMDAEAKQQRDTQEVLLQIDRDQLSSLVRVLNSGEGSHWNGRFRENARGLTANLRAVRETPA